MLFQVKFFLLLTGLNTKTKRFNKVVLHEVHLFKSVRFFGQNQVFTRSAVDLPAAIHKRSSFCYLPPYYLHISAQKSE